jgi:hypothetical protein
MQNIVDIASKYILKEPARRHDLAVTLSATPEIGFTMSDIIEQKLQR